MYHFMKHSRDCEENLFKWEHFVVEQINFLFVLLESLAPHLHYIF